MTRPLPLLALVACASLDPVVDTSKDADPTDTETTTTGDEGDDDDDDTSVVTTTADTGEPLPACVDALFPGPGTTSGASDDGAGSCGGEGGADVTVLFRAPEAGRWRFDLSDAFDTVLYVLDACGGTELACADTDGPEVVAVDLAEGDEGIVVVDAAGAGQGAYTLEATLAPDVEADCSDGIDDDVDGLPDCLDPDCVDLPLCEETCDDGLDNDGDGLFDCMDPSCDAAPTCAAPCADAVVGGPLPISF